LFNQSQLSRGAPDSVRCAKLDRANWLLSGFIGDVRLQIIGLSGEPFTGEVVALGKRLTAYGYKSPDYPVVHWTVQ
jgi:hypothetical protein